MFDGSNGRASPSAGSRTSRACTAVLMVMFTAITTGCTVSLAPLAKHTAAFSKATASIVDSSEDAYRSAIRLHHQEQVAKAAAAYNNDPNWSPYAALGTPLLTPEQLDARITVLQALKVYAESLADLTNSKKQYAPVGVAAAAAGTNLQSLSTAAKPYLPKLFPSISAMTDAEANGVSTAIAGIAGLLVNDEVQKSLKKTTQDMNPNVKALCGLLNSDVKILRRQANVDYQTMLTDDNQLLTHNQIDPLLRRNEVVKLLELADQQQANDALLDKLQKALVSLALTHDALAAAAQGNNPESIKQHLADLINAGQELGNYYKSLSSST